MKKNATGLSEAQLQGKDRVVSFGNYRYFIGGDSTLGNLITAGLIPNRGYKNISRKPDGLIIKGSNDVIGVVEYKKPSVFKSDKQVEDACNQALEVAEELDAKFIVATDGINKTRWINAYTKEDIVDIESEKITKIFKFENENNIDKNLIKIVSQIDDKVSMLNNVIGSIEFVDPTPLAKKVWDRLYAATSAKPEDCLYTFVEIFIFKYLSDIGVLTGPESFKGCLVNYRKEKADDLLTYYAQTIRKKIKRLFPESVDGTTIINGTIFVNKEDVAKEGYGSMFRDILETFDEFGELKNIDYEFKSKLFELFFKEDRTQGGLGQYFTPLKVVQQMVRMSEIREGMRICDPACGVGKFILDAATRKTKDRNGRVIKNNFAEFYPVENGVLTPKITIEGYDKGFTTNQARTIILAKANMLIYFSDLLKDHPDITTQVADLFNNTFHLKASVLGTLGYIPSNKEKYDLILANPPYMATGNNDIKNEIAKDKTLSKLYSVGGIGLESLFIIWIVNALKENGIANIVVPDGILSRNADKSIRQYILDNCEINSIISLPVNTFFSTSKKTYILSLTKKTKSMGVQTKPVFTYLVSTIGETLDANRFEIDSNDLEKAVNQYNMFKGTPYAYISNDPRCKVIDFEKFENTSQNWLIENFWSDTEKIKIGIKQKDATSTIEDLQNSISELLLTVKVQQEKVKNLSSPQNVLKQRKSVLEVATMPSIKYLGYGAKGINNMGTKKSGTYSIWTAAKEPVGYTEERIESKLIMATKDNMVLSISANGDGSAGRNLFIHMAPFYIDSGRVILLPKEDIDIEYLYYSLLDMKEKYGFCRAKPVNKRNMEYVTVDIPVDNFGNFDIDCQKQMVQIYKTIDAVKVEVNKKVASFINNRVILNSKEE